MALGTFFNVCEKSGIVRREKRTRDETYLETHDAVDGTGLELLDDIPWRHATGHRYWALNSRICRLGYHAWDIHRFLANINCYNLPLGIVKSAANLFLCVYTHFQSTGKADVCAVQGTFGDILALADYSQLGDVVGGIAYYPLGMWCQAIPFNATGLTWIIPGTTKLGVRLSGDVEAWEPPCDGNALRCVRSRLIAEPAWDFNPQPVYCGIYDAVCGGGGSVTLAAKLYGYDCPYLEVEYSGVDSPTYPRHRFIYKLSSEDEWTHQTEWQSGIATDEEFSAIVSGIESGEWYDYRTETEKRAGEVLHSSFLREFRCYFEPPSPLAINKSYALGREEL